MIPNIYSLEFWEELYKQYQPHPGLVTLCNNSKSVRLLWGDSDKRRELVELAREFLSQYNISHEYHVSGDIFLSTLFNLNNTVESEKEFYILHRRVRKDFISYWRKNINKHLKTKLS